MSLPYSYVINESEMRSVRYFTNDKIRNDEIRLKLDMLLRALDGKNYVLVVKTDMARYDVLSRASAIIAHVEVITMDELILNQPNYKKKKLITYHAESNTILPIAIQSVKQP